MKREKCFGTGRRVPLDRNAKVRILTKARSYLHRGLDGAEKPAGKAYGHIKGKYLAVLQTLLYDFHNAASGACFPSYEAIAEKARCCRQTVYEAIRALEQAGLLNWCNRIVRRIVTGRVHRTSNAYVLIDPQPCKSSLQTGTPNQLLILSGAKAEPGLEAALGRLGSAIRTACG